MFLTNSSNQVIHVMTFKKCLHIKTSYEELNCKTAYVHIDMFLIFFSLKSMKRLVFPFFSEEHVDMDVSCFVI